MFRVKINGGEKMTIVKCENCGETFAYQHRGDVYPGGKDLESADCPYCGKTAFSLMTSGFIDVYKVDDKGEIIYK